MACCKHRGNIWKMKSYLRISTDGILNNTLWNVKIKIPCVWYPIISETNQAKHQFIIWILWKLLFSQYQFNRLCFLYSQKYLFRFSPRHMNIIHFQVDFPLIVWEQVWHMQLLHQRYIHQICMLNVDKADMQIHMDINITNILSVKQYTIFPHNVIFVAFHSFGYSNSSVCVVKGCFTGTVAMKILSQCRKSSPHRYG